MSINQSELNDILKSRDKSVVVDISGFDIFYTILQNSDPALRRQVRNRIKIGEIIPLNADALGDFASYHAMFHIALGHESDIPSIPTLTTLEVPDIGPVRQFFGKYQPNALPGIFFHKKSGISHSHGGKGITLIREGDIKDVTPTDINTFIQPFIIPPADENGKRIVRDYRVYTVGGKPITGILKEAAEPLSNANLNGREIPLESRYPAADHTRIIRPKDNNPIWDKIFHHAEAVAQFLSQRVSRTPSRLFSSRSPFGFGTIDFILDDRGVPLPVDFDLAPEINPSAIDELSKAMSIHLQKLAKGENITFISFPGNNFLTGIKSNLLESNFPEDRIKTITVEIKSL